MTASDTRRAPPVRLAPLVEQLVAALIRRKEHPAFTWISPDQVLVSPDGMLPTSPSPETAFARRKRFRTLLDQHVSQEE